MAEIQRLGSRYFFRETIEIIKSTENTIEGVEVDGADDMSSGGKLPTQHRLYIINRAGTGEAHYVVLTPDRTDIQSFKVQLDTWKLLKNIAYFGVVVLDNKLYVIGGYDIVRCKHLDRVVRYDPFESMWMEVAPLSKARAKFGACALNGKIYVCGGERSDGRVSSSCEVYDPTKDEWSSGAVLISPRSNHSCLVFQNELFLAGGDYGTQSHDNFWVFEKGEWEELDSDYPHSLPFCLDRMAMTAVENKIYFVGGVSCKPNSASSEGKNRFFTERGMFSYSSSISAMTRQRSQVNGIQADMISPWKLRYPSMSYARHSHGIFAVGSKIYVFGGMNLDTGAEVRNVECFDTEKGTWEEDFRFRKGDVSNCVCAALEVPTRHDEKKVKFHLKWVMW